MGYRASQQASTKHSHYYMLYQQHMKLPIDAEILSCHTSKCDGDLELETTIDCLLKSRKETFKKAEVYKYY